MLYNTTLSQNSTQTKAQALKRDKAPGILSNREKLLKTDKTAWKLGKPIKSDKQGGNRYQKYAFSSPMH